MIALAFWVWGSCALTGAADSGKFTKATTRIRVNANLRFFIVQPFLPIAPGLEKISVDTVERESLHQNANTESSQQQPRSLTVMIAQPRLDTPSTRVSDAICPFAVVTFSGGVPPPRGTRRRLFSGAGGRNATPLQHTCEA